MFFSYTHIVMLAVLSFFTAMLAPGVESASISGIPYAMTNLSFLTYSFLGLNILLFLCAGFHLRQAAKIIGIIILIHVIVFLFLTLGGFVQSNRGQYMNSLSWGWIFLGVGFITLIYGIHIIKRHSSQYPYKFFDTIISVSGTLVLTIITAVIIYISQVNTYKSSHILEKTFNKETIQTQSGVTLSPAFQKIDNFTFTRSKDQISFIGKTATGYIQYPKRNISKTFPDQIFYTRNANFIIQGDDLLLKNKKHSKIHYFSDRHIISSSEDKTYVLTQSGALLTLELPYQTILSVQEKKDDIYWIGADKSRQTLYKNTTPFLVEFFHIRKYAIDEKTGSIILLAKKNRDNEYQIYKNGTLFDGSEEFVPVHFFSNGKNVWYTKKNDDDTFSVYFNNNATTKKYGTLLRAFLQNDDDGYVFFAKYPGEKNICIITRYQGELCGFKQILQPQLEADENGVIFMGFKNEKWQIYRNTKKLITHRTLPYDLQDAQNLHFFFDVTHPEYFMIIQKKDDGYQINKRGKLLPKIWKNIKMKPFFGYDGKILIEVQDDTGWHIAEL